MSRYRMMHYSPNDKAIGKDVLLKNRLKQEISMCCEAGRTLERRRLRNFVHVGHEADNRVDLRSHRRIRSRTLGCMQVATLEMISPKDW